MKLDGAIHLRIIGGGESMDMDENSFNYAVKRGPRRKKPYALGVGQRRMSPKRRHTKNE